MSARGNLVTHLRAIKPRLEGLSSEFIVQNIIMDAANWTIEPMRLAYMLGEAHTDLQAEWWEVDGDHLKAIEDAQEAILIYIRGAE